MIATTDTIIAAQRLAMTYGVRAALRNAGFPEATATSEGWLVAGDKQWPTVQWSSGLTDTPRPTGILPQYAAALADAGYRVTSGTNVTMAFYAVPQAPDLLERLDAIRTVPLEVLNRWMRAYAQARYEAIAAWEAEYPALLAAHTPNTPQGAH